MDSLISGETGTDKEEISKLLYRNSHRKKVFVRITCGAISPELIESELFGYEKATFTGTNNSGKLGRFEVLILDEVGGLSL